MMARLQSHLSGASIDWQRQIVAGVVTAIVSFPLSIGFAILAGVPPIVMIVSSIYVAFFNALLASSRYGVGGPNTAVALLTGSALAPFAPLESHLYMGYVLALTVMVGLIQLGAAAVIRKVDFTDYISNTVIDGLIVGIGFIFVLASFNMAIGLAPDRPDQWIVFNVFTSLVLLIDGQANYDAVILSTITLSFGLMCRWYKPIKPYAVLLAIVLGIFLGQYMMAFHNARLEMVGWLSLNMFATSLPDFRPVSWTVMFQLAGSAAVIALVGILQTLSIAKSIKKPQEPYEPAVEVYCQGFGHLFLGFFQGCPGSNAFNKSLLMYDLGGGRLAIALSGVFTVMVMLLFPQVVAAIPMPALGACLILVGISMLNPAKQSSHFNTGRLHATVFVVSTIAVLLLGIKTAIIVGAVLSVLLHFIDFSKLSIGVKQHGQSLVIQLNGILFFASCAGMYGKLQKALADYPRHRQYSLVIDLSEVKITHSDALDLSWLAQLVQDFSDVSLLCYPHQQEELRVLLKRNGLADCCPVGLTQ